MEINKYRKYRIEKIWKIDIFIIQCPTDYIKQNGNPT